MINSPPVQESANLLVLTRHHRMKGNWRGAAAGESVVEALNDEKGALSLAPVLVEELDGSRPSIMATIAVDKSQITAVVLKGTDIRNCGGEGTQATASPGRAVVVLSAPPYMAQGEIHWWFAREIQRLGKAEVSEGGLGSLPRFLELTDGWLFLSLAPVASHSVLLLNRDHVTETHVLGQDSDSAGRLSKLFSGLR